MLALIGMQITAHAHLMAVDRATLNFRDDGAFMVLSLTPSSFEGIQLDDDGDGVISLAEFLNHQNQLQQAIAQNVQLIDAKGPLLLEGLFVSFEPAHAPNLEQPSIIALGKFVTRPGSVPTRWSIGLWPLQSKSNPIEAKVTSQAPDGTVIKQESLVFTSSKSSQKLFSHQSDPNEDVVLMGVFMLFLVACALFFQSHRARNQCLP